MRRNKKKEGKNHFLLRESEETKKKTFTTMLIALILSTVSIAHAKYFSNLYDFNNDANYNDGSYTSITIVEYPELLYVAGGKIYSVSDGKYLPVVTIVNHVGEPVRTLDVSTSMDEIVAMDTFVQGLKSQVLVAGNKGKAGVLMYFDTSLVTTSTTAVNTTNTNFSLNNKRLVITDARVLPYTQNENEIIFIGSYEDIVENTVDYWVVMIARDGTLRWQKRATVGNPSPPPGGIGNIFMEYAVALDVSPKRIVIVGNFRAISQPSNSLYFDPTSNIDIMELDYAGNFKWNLRFQSEDSGTFSTDQANDISYVLDSTGTPLHAVVTGWTDHDNSSWPGGGQDLLLLKADIGLWQPPTLVYVKQMALRPPGNDNEIGESLFVNSNGRVIVAGSGVHPPTELLPDGLIAGFDLASGDFAFGRTYGEYSRFRRERIDKFIGMTHIGDEMVIVGANGAITELRGLTLSRGWLAHLKADARGGYVRPFSITYVRPYVGDVPYDWEYACPLNFFDISSNISLSDIVSYTLPTSKVPMPAGRTPGWMDDDVIEFDMSLLFRAYSGPDSGKNKWWSMDNMSMTTEHSILSVPDTDWHIVGADDLNGDEITDIIWRNYLSGINAVLYGFYDAQGLWQLLLFGALLPTEPNLDWEIRGTGDFNRDGQVDIVWRNKVSGENRVWEMMGPWGITIGNIRTLPPFNNTTFNIAGTADADSDGFQDIIWERPNLIYIWRMRRYTRIQGQFVMNKNPNEYIGAIGDMNADGHVDIILRNNQTGDNRVVIMNGESCPNWNAIASIWITSPLPLAPDWVMEGL